MTYTNDSQKLENSHGGWLVQKFGGTSLGKYTSEIADEIIKPGLICNRIVIVCSARSNDNKKSGTTNRLLHAAEFAITKDSSKLVEIIEAIRQDHLEAARRLIKDNDILDLLEVELSTKCEKVKKFLLAVQTIEEISPRYPLRVLMFSGKSD